MITQEQYQELRDKGHLSDKGLLHLIGMLEGKLIDRSEQFKEVLSKKGLTKKDA